MTKRRSREKLPTTLKLSLFSTSYVPLFGIIIFKQITDNYRFLSFGGISIQSLVTMVEKFGVAIVLVSLSIYGIFGMTMFLRFMKETVRNNGHQFQIRKVQNKNNESIGYVATYLVPFMFQSFSTLFEISSFFVLLIVIYIIYTHSTLIIVNPLLNLRYSLYDIEYLDTKSAIESQGTFIVDCHYVEKGDLILANGLGSNLYFAILEEGSDE